VKQFYAGTPYVPSEVFLAEEIEEKDVIEEWLGKKRGRKVSLLTPKKGQKEKLLELASKNAALVLAQDAEKIKREEAKTIGAVHQIEELLGLPNIVRMEAFDISNTSGFANVASMVVFENGKPKKSDYRKFKMKTVTGPDDYACMREALTRRFEHGLALSGKNGENSKEDSFVKFPDLLLMDGGRGQVNIAEEVLAELGIRLPVCGMVKDDNHRTRGLYYKDKELEFPTGSEAIHMITALQDETHRFAITYHKQLRSEGQTHSILDDIQGIGPKRRKALLLHFKDIEAIKNATIDELEAVDGMNQKSAEAVYNFFN
jgi:excinuclease ABC subunit C